MELLVPPSQARAKTTIIGIMAPRADGTIPDDAFKAAVEATNPNLEPPTNVRAASQPVFDVLPPVVAAPKPAEEAPYAMLLDVEHDTLVDPPEAGESRPRVGTVPGFVTPPSEAAVPASPGVQPQLQVR